MRRARSSPAADATPTSLAGASSTDTSRGAARVCAPHAFGEAGLTLAEEVFAAWNQYRRDGDRTRLIEQIEPLKHELRTYSTSRSQEHQDEVPPPVRQEPAQALAGAVDLRRRRRRRVDQQPRRGGLRGAVIYRKLSLGSQSEQGERTIERLHSASVTCRLQGRSLFAYLTDVLTANIRGDPIPALA